MRRGGDLVEAIVETHMCSLYEQHGVRVRSHDYPIFAGDRSTAILLL